VVAEERNDAMNDVIVWGHRGAMAYAPENTLEAFELAVRQGAAGMEIDIHTTSDGEIVVIHDESIDRTTSGSGLVSEMTLAEVRGVYANTGFESQYPDARVPALADVLDVVERDGLQLNIEVKDIFTHDASYATIAGRAADMVRERSLVDQVIFSSFNHTSMARLKAEHPEQRTALLLMMDLYQIGRYARTTGADAIHPGFLGLSESTVESARAEGLAVNAWTMPPPFTAVSERDQLQRMIDLGVDAVITNIPDVAVELATARV
jgi:glycerophosphoryl diester phosphodiesterase